MLGIIGAMDVETDMLKSEVQNKKTEIFAQTEFVSGTIGNTDVVVCKCGVGKVNSAVATQVLIDKYNVCEILNVGVACSLSEEVQIGNAVVATDFCQWDIDITALGEPRGYIENIDKIKIPTSKKLSEKVYKACKDCDMKVFKGTVASADTFIANNETKAMLKKEFGAIAGEMEGASIAHTAYLNNVEFSALRCISDGGDADAQIDYPKFKKIAAQKETAIVLKMLNV